MPQFIAQAREGRLATEPYMAEKLRAYLTKNPGIRLTIEPYTPESNDQRRYFEGAIVPLITFYQEGLDHKNTDDLRRVREWLKVEFNGEAVAIKGKIHKVGKSTKGKLNKGFIERVMDWMCDQGYQVELLNPKDFKHWRDAIRSFSDGPPNYIDYLQFIGKLKTNAPDSS